MPKFTIKPKEILEVSSRACALPPGQAFDVKDGTYQVPDGASSETVVRSNSCYVTRLPENDATFQCPTLRGINRNSDIFRVKNAHSNEWVQWEILAAKFAGLSGIAVPWTVFCTGAEKDNSKLANDCKKRKDIATLEGRPNYFVASQRLRGYHDFSTFIDYVHDKQLDAFFPEGDSEANVKRSGFLDNYEELTRIKKLPTPNTAENKILKRDAMLGCFALMPEPIRDMMDEAYVVSAWLGNWDMFNWDLTNIGFTVLHKKDGSADIFPAIIDFGNCLQAGFGGKHKEDSLESANTAAKLYSEDDKNPRHYDYDQSPIQPISRIDVAMFGAIPGLALASIPRREPFEALFVHNDEQVIKCLENSRDDSGRLSNGFIRGLYRIASITDESINAVTSEWFHLGEAINYTSPDASKHYSKEYLAGLMKQRKDFICMAFAPEIAQYVALDEAAETKKEIQDSIFDITGQQGVAKQRVSKAASDSNLRYRDHTKSPTRVPINRINSSPLVSIDEEIVPQQLSSLRYTSFTDMASARSNSAPPRLGANTSTRQGF